MDNNAGDTLTGVSEHLAHAVSDTQSTTDSHAGHGAENGRLYGGLTVVERRAVRRKRLLDAGLELIAEHGYPSTTIEGICARAGVTARHFYEEFSAREELLRAVFDLAIDTTILEISARLDEIPKNFEGADNLEVMMRIGVSTFIHAFLGDPRHARVVCIEAVGVSAEMEAHRRELLHRFSKLLQSEAERISGRTDVWNGHFDLATRALVGGTSELIVDWLLESDPAPLDVLSDVIACLYLAVINYH